MPRQSPFQIIESMQQYNTYTLWCQDDVMGTSTCDGQLFL